MPDFDLTDFKYPPSLPSLFFSETLSARAFPSPNEVGMEGPVMSASRIAVLNPSLFTLQAKRLVTSDFPTPPLPETIPITFFTEEPE